MPSNSRKVPLWLPYTRSIKVKRGNLHFEYKGGEEKIRPERIHSILFYGAVCPLEEDFLEICRRFSIPVTFHRRHVATALWIHSTPREDPNDIITLQINARCDERKRRHIARKLLSAKFKSMSWLLAPPPEKLHPGLNIDKLRNIESRHAREYWQRYFAQLGLPGAGRRDKTNPVARVLDAVSKFLTGIILRWIIYHHLSPHHGFLHKPSSYPSLAYDLLEPYRGDADRCVFRSLKSALSRGETQVSRLTGIAIEDIKRFLDEKVYTHVTRQIVTRHELFHGAVLALRSYLEGTSTRFLVPTPTFPNGGRPVKAGFVLYGRQAGRTNFWEEARRIARDTTAKQALWRTNKIKERKQ
jgi:CRISPR-associated endonuclease Cas1